MPNSPFNFARPTMNTITLKDGKTGRLRQSVTNVSGRSLEAITLIETNPADSPAREWIRVEPEGTVTFDINGSAHYDLIVEVPEGETLVEDVTFKLVIADEHDPEEEYTSGPELTFVTGPAQSIPWKSIIPAIIAGIVILGLIIVLTMWFNRDQSPRLIALANGIVYQKPHTSSPEVFKFNKNDKLSVVNKNNDSTWFWIKADNDKEGWVEDDKAVLKKSGDFSDVPVLDVPIETVVTTFELNNNAIHYYVVMDAPGTIEVSLNWDFLATTVIVTFHDDCQEDITSLRTDGNSSPLRCTVTEKEWNANKVRHISLSNDPANDMMLNPSFNGTIEIQYPIESISDASFMDEFFIKGGRLKNSSTNIIAQVSEPGSLNLNIDVKWDNPTTEIEAQINLPKQDDYIKMLRESNGVSLEYDASNLVVGDLWVIRLIKRNGSNTSGTVTVQHH